MPEWGQSSAASGCRERRRHVLVLLGMEALARQPRPWSATGCKTEITRIASHRSPARKSSRKYRIASYGLTQEQFDRLLAAQQHACGTCDEPFEEGQLIHVDHGHACCRGKNRSCGECIRGLLCHTCNIALGHIERRYAMARAYLDNPRDPGLCASICGGRPIGAGCAERAAVDAVAEDCAQLLSRESYPTCRIRRSGGPERGSVG